MIKRLRRIDNVKEALVRAIPVEILVPVNKRGPDWREYSREFVYEECGKYAKHFRGYLDHHVHEWTLDTREPFNLSCYVVVFTRDDRNIFSRFLALF